MTFTYNIALAGSTDQMRILLADTDSDNHAFEDEELTGIMAFAVPANLQSAPSAVYRAAATALESIATNEARILKVATVADVTTNGAALAKQLGAQATAWRAQADLLDVQTFGGFGYAEQVFDISTWRERLLNQALRLNPS